MTRCLTNARAALGCKHRHGSGTMTVSFECSLRDSNPYRQHYPICSTTYCLSWKMVLVAHGMEGRATLGFQFTAGDIGPGQILRETVRINCLLHLYLRSALNRTPPVLHRMFAGPVIIPSLLSLQTRSSCESRFLGAFSFLLGEMVKTLKTMTKLGRGRENSTLLNLIGTDQRACFT